MEISMTPKKSIIINALSLLLLYPNQQIKGMQPSPYPLPPPYTYGKPVGTPPPKYPKPPTYSEHQETEKKIIFNDIIHALTNNQLNFSPKILFKRLDPKAWISIIDHLKHHFLTSLILTTYNAPKEQYKKIETFLLFALNQLELDLKYSPELRDCLWTKNIDGIEILEVAHRCNLDTVVEKLITIKQSLEETSQNKTDTAENKWSVTAHYREGA